MGRFSISKRFGFLGERSGKACAVMEMFGVSRERLAEGDVEHRCEIEINDGDVVYITGPSGAGKSVLLRELTGQFDGAEIADLNEVELSGEKSVIDCIDGSVVDSLGLLSKAGLNDVFCVLNRPVHLSDGQKYRFRLAKVLSSGKRVVVADEFCSDLDRITAAVISHNICRYAKEHGVTFILAGCHDDILADLQPGVLVVKGFDGKAEVIYRNQK